MRDGRPVTVEVTADGAGLVSRAGAALLAQVADKLGLTSAVLLRLAAVERRRRGHDPGRVIRDLAVMLADGGECVSHLGGVRNQEALFGPVASDSTAFRVVEPDRVGARAAGSTAGVACSGARPVLEACGCAWSRSVDDRSGRDVGQSALATKRVQQKRVRVSPADGLWRSDPRGSRRDAQARERRGERRGRSQRSRSIGRSRRSRASTSRRP